MSDQQILTLWDIDSSVEASFTTEVPVSEIVRRTVELWLNSGQHSVRDDFDLLADYVVKAVGWPCGDTSCRTYSFKDICRLAEVDPDERKGLQKLTESPANGYAVSLPGPNHSYEFRYYHDAAMGIIEELRRNGRI